jgi:hypothetical protein
MPRTFAAAVLLVALGLLSPGKAVAGPPEGAPGKMTFDAVADGLRRYHRERDMDKCIPLLQRLAPTKDPRVAVAMGEFCENERRAGLPPGINSCLYIAAQDLLRLYYISTDQSANEWWDRNKADLRRRAAQLPK